MKAIFKKETRGFLTSMIGYVFIAFLLAFIGIYFTAYHLQGMYPKMAYTLQSVLIAFLILVPILTMRTIAEERRQKTDQLLLTAPVSVWSIVLGKYLALLCVFSIPILVLCTYPIILSQFGSVPYPETYCALFGYFLLGAACLSIGLFLSSVTESQIIAAVLTFFVLFVSYVMSGVASFFPETAAGSYFAIAILAAALAFLIWHMLGKALIAFLSAVILEGASGILYFVKPVAYEGLIQKLLNVLNTTAHFEEFAEGMLDVKGIVYYLSLILLFLFLTVQAIQKRRWGTDRGSVKNGSYSMSMIAIFTAGAVAVNLIAGELPSGYTQIDLTEQKLSVLSEQSKEIVRSLDQDVTIYYILQDSNRDENISRLLTHYEELSSHLTVEEIDPVRSPKFTQQYTNTQISENSVIVACGDVNRVIDYNDMYESEFDYTYYSYTTTGFDAEGQITSAIAAVSSADLPKVYTLTGHGEQTLDESLLSEVEKENLSLDSLNLIGENRVPEDAAVLLILSPASDLTDAETNRLLSYLMQGGCVLIITDYIGIEMPNLDRVMEAYGIRKTEGVVMENSPENYVQIPYYLIPAIEACEVTDEMTGGSSYVIMAAAQGLTASEEIQDELTVTDVLTTSSSSYSKINVETMQTYSKEEGDIDGPFALGMTAEKTIELTDARIQEAEALLEDGDVTENSSQKYSLGDTQEASAFEDLMDTEPAESIEKETADTGTEDTIDENDADTDTTAESEEEAAGEEGQPETVTAKLAVYTSSSLLDPSMNQRVSGGNRKLFLNTLSWMCGHEQSVSVPVKSLSVSYLTVNAASSNFWSIVVIGVIPGVFLIYGFYVWLKRRKK